MKQKISILILSAILVSCAERPFPTDYVYVVDVVHGVCAKKKIVDKENVVFEHVEDLPLIECDGNVSIAKEDFPAVKDWVKWAIKKGKECESALK